MSITFTKLFSSITESTIWCEDSDVRVVWITMLAMADKNGRVWSSLPGLAKRAAVTLEKTKEAIELFLSPDEYSRTKNNEGRRIEDIDGGWRLLNHAKYREIRDEEERKAYKRDWIKNKRNEGKSVDNVDRSRPQSTYTEADTEAVEKNTSSSDEIYVTKKRRTLKSEQLQNFIKFWSVFNYKTGKAEAADSWIDLKVTADQLTEILKGARAEAENRPTMKKSGRTPKMAQGWLSGRRWEDESAGGGSAGYSEGSI